ncbi:hypothetical protein [Phytohabitans rumicis]|uniref:Uncharacterized protein n=1 Tax=Phytohabitans rumicis TaxID=1076125 RepID=A0A6V8L8K4_9ACTN|nr:hypothetical protein [Phytohabitans rumicis]GFJ91910.1 hypothetical protein Prum_055520 [Phytohabitans rumicis]
MAKGKFELVFMAGGLLLDVVANRLRRAPATPREAVGAAMHALTYAFEQKRDELAEADAGAIDAQLTAIREELCADSPHRLLLSAYLDELAERVKSDDELTADVERVREKVASWLG